MAVLAQTAAIAETAVFVPDMELQVDEVILRKNKGRIETRQIFLNPASLGGVQGWQILTSRGQHRFDYNSVTFAALTPFIFNGGISLGYHRFSSDDIEEVRHDGYKPYVSGYFSDTYQLLVISYGMDLSSDLAVGMRIQNLDHRLFTSLGSSQSADLGMFWMINDVGLLSIYTQNLFQSSLAWLKDGTTETSVRELLETEVKIGLSQAWDLFRGRVNTRWTRRGFKMGSLSAEMELHPLFGIFSHFFFNKQFQFERYSIGTVLQFDQVIFKYALLRIEKNAFVTEEHIFGIEIVEFID